MKQQMLVTARTAGGCGTFAVMAVGLSTLVGGTVLGLGGCANKTNTYRAAIATTDTAAGENGGGANPNTAPAAVGALALDIENTFGSVWVQVDAKLTEPEIDARLIDDATGNLAKLERGERPPWVTAELQRTEGRGVLRVSGQLPAAEAARFALKGDPFVMLWVRVPACDGIRVRNSGGSVDLDNVGGAITVENTARENAFGRRADVMITTNRVMDDPVSLSTTHGNVLLRIPPGSKGRFELTADAGETEFLAKQGVVDNAVQKQKSYACTLNKGMQKVTLYSGRGDSRVEVREPREFMRWAPGW